MTILYTAFKGLHNTSFQLVQKLHGQTLLLTNSFAGILRDIASSPDHHGSVIMFGVDKNLQGCIRFDTCAKLEDKTIRSAFHLQTLTEKCDTLQLNYTVSHTPTNYLCNTAYWHMLRKQADTIFVHIPSGKGMTPELMERIAAVFNADTDNPSVSLSADSCLRTARSRL